MNFAFIIVMKASTKSSILATKKSFKEIYDENRLLYAKKEPIIIQAYDPTKAASFLAKFHEKRAAQKKRRVYLFALSCLITLLLVAGIVNAMNGGV